MDFQRDILEMIQIVKGSIVTTTADIIVNSTDTSFSAAGGIDYAIHKAAGDELAKALRNTGKLEAGQAIITPAFALNTAKQIIHTVGPKWQNGFCAEEFTLAGCYRNSLKLALENNCTSIAFPCISVGANRFPEQRAAEIALNAIYTMLRATADFSLNRILFVCNSEQQKLIYKKHLKRMIIDEFLYWYSPESYHVFPSTEKYYKFMCLLAELEWGSASQYKNYCSNFTQVSGNPFPGKYTKYDQYAFNMDTWDYSTCLSYIIYLQRSAYWSGGSEAPHYDQWVNGTVRKTLLRMRTRLI